MGLKSIAIASLSAILASILAVSVASASNDQFPEGTCGNRPFYPECGSDRR